MCHARTHTHTHTLTGEDFVFKNACVGNNIPPEFFSAIEKGFTEGASKGLAIGHPIQGVRVVLEDGQAHMVDSNEISFRLAALHAFKKSFHGAAPQILEPIMHVEVDIPAEFQTGVVGGLNKRKGMINNVQVRVLLLHRHGMCVCVYLCVFVCDVRCLFSHFRLRLSLSISANAQRSSQRARGRASERDVRLQH
jgi:translation elongation factor EF-G